MFSGGIGTIDADFVQKNKPQVGMSVAKIGGPVYRYSEPVRKLLMDLIVLTLKDWCGRRRR